LFSLSDKIQEWTMNSIDEPNYNDIFQYLQFRAPYYDQFHPTIGPFPPFMERLKTWVGGAKEEEDQKALFTAVPDILYLGMEEFIALYRTAYHEQILQWLVEMEKLRYDSPTFQKELEEAVAKTWFCPITDSMHIADFYHVNNITHIDDRPDWRSLRQFGSIDEIINYMYKNNLSNIVLLEDFIGSGSQACRSIIMAASLSKNFRILVVPLIICPEGQEMGQNLEGLFHNVQFKPVLSLPKEMFLHVTPIPGEPQSYGPLRNTIIKLADIVDSPDGPFGFHDTGGMIVMYTNSPDNTIPVINNRSSTWDPLFPRSSRL
jgi:hypothetical protein